MLYICTTTHLSGLKWKTLFEMVNKSIPDVSHLRVFGTAAYVFLPDNIRANKLVPKSELMIFLGYPDSVKGYLFLRLHNNLPQLLLHCLMKGCSLNALT